MIKKTVISCNMAYQIGTIRSLLTGVYEGDLSFAALARYGDFGLGTFDGVDGEMIALDGIFYRIDDKGNAHGVRHDMKTPFGVVTHFQAIEKHLLHSFKNLPALQNYVSSFFESENIIYALRIEGTFLQVRVRSEHPQPEGHKPLSETISQVQTKFTFQELTGTLVGFWFPEYLKTINVPGFHFHFLDSNHKVGGHLFDLQLEHGALQIMPLFDFGMHLIHTPLFEHVDLSSHQVNATETVETDRE